MYVVYVFKNKFLKQAETVTRFKKPGNESVSPKMRFYIACIVNLGRL